MSPPNKDHIPIENNMGLINVVKFIFCEKDFCNEIYQHTTLTLGSSYIFKNNYNTYLQFHIVYCRDVIQHKVQVTTDIVYSASQLHMMLLV